MVCDKYPQMTFARERAFDCTRSNNRPGVATVDEHEQPQPPPKNACDQLFMHMRCANYRTCNVAIDSLTAASGIGRSDETIDLDRRQKSAVVLQTRGCLLGEISSRLYDDCDGRTAAAGTGSRATRDA
jgi:hypothetical protein